MKQACDASSLRDDAFQLITPHPHCAADHFAQFYDDDEYLSRAVAAFLAEGMEQGEPVLLLATSEHNKQIGSLLAARGFDLEHVEMATFLDVHDVLTEVMDGSLPSEQRFRAVLQPAVSRATAAGRRLHVFGEAVDVLWRAGNPDAALRLEELWNDLLQAEPVVLLCGCSMNNFKREVDTRAFQEVCRQHAQVRPAQSSGGGTDQQARELALLQQKARALESQIEHRKMLERALRDALADRRRAEEAARSSEQELRDFLENAVQPMHWLGPDGIILWANRAELELLGYAREEYVGHHISEFHDALPVIEDILERLHQGQTVRAHPARLRSKDGTLKEVLIDSNVLWQDGQFRHTHSFTRDVTEQKRAELALEQARADAERAHAAKSDFLAVVSHELRTPLNGIIGYQDLLYQEVGGPATPRQREYLERIRSGAEQLLGLIDQLLSFSRIEAGQQEVTIDYFEANDLAQQTAELVQPIAARRKLVITVATHLAVVSCQNDAGKLRQILLNLLSNAIKFSTNGNITVAVTASDHEVSFAVRDAGVGIPESELARIFEPFVQIDALITRQSSGIGLGLPLSRQLARLLGGELTVESQVGKGSTFTLNVPRVYAQPAP